MSKTSVYVFVRPSVKRVTQKNEKKTFANILILREISVHLVLRHEARLVGMSPSA